MKVNRIVACGLALALAALVSTTGFAAPAAKSSAPAKSSSSAKATRVARVKKAAPAGKVNLNTATAAELTALPGVGAKLAARIVEHRQKVGGFKSTQELMNVKGLGEKNYTKIQGYLSVGDAARNGASR
jgi:competence protein ComEA